MSETAVREKPATAPQFCVTANTFKRRKKGWWLDQPYKLSDLGLSLIEVAA